ncbi:MAG: exodeoxyribonuclease VII small subunit [Holosporales bacterium]|jgi:exodeoxyribonuclease VII small subunit|nr:exodeoxyribonuclease VII small subunit [Holosporales bacterium]
MSQEEITFENAITELENIIKKLEGGNLPLESAVSTFERGTYLKKICETKLKDAQLKIEMLSKE